MMKSAPHPYADPLYAAALGTDTLSIPEWGTPVLIRPIPGTRWKDAAGFYPFAAIAREADIPGGLARLRDAGALSVVLVPDPIAGPPESSLTAAFPVFRRFKTHYLVDRDRPLNIGSNHRRNIRKAQANCFVEVIKLDSALRDWNAIYQYMILVRGATDGISDFAPEYFAELAKLPCLTTLAAFCEGEMIAASLWLRHGDTVYYHLGASLRIGYDKSAMFGVFAFALKHFRECRILHLGGNAGNDDMADDGLSFFKRGFSNATATTHICGAVLDEGRNAMLSAKFPDTTFFPRYRATFQPVE
jgi:hypothetical protein